MALVFADRVTDTSITAGTLDFVLLGTPPGGFQAWSVIGNTNTAYYTATDGSGNWETGIGTYSSTGPTLARTTVLASSNSNAKVSFPAGTKTVFNDPAAAWLAAPVVIGLLDISATTAGQIQFPAAQNASSNANTQDDYEEGTFTPTYTATGCTFSYATRTGTYTKIGNLFSIFARVTLNTTGNTLAGNAISVSTPFTSAAVVSGGFVAWSSTTSSYVFLQVNVSSGFAFLIFHGATAATTGIGSNQLANAVLSATAGTDMQFVATIQTST